MRTLGVVILVLSASLRASAEPPRRGPLAAFLSWFKDGSRGVIYDRSCDELRLKRAGDALVVRVNVTTKVSGATKTVTSQELIVDQSLALTDGSNVNYQRKGARWIEVSSGGTGGARSLGYSLSKVKDNAAWFSLEAHSSGGGTELVELPHPFFFRTRDACSEYSRRHPLSNTDERPW